MYIDTSTLIIIGMWLIAIGVLLVWITETPKEKAIRHMGTHRKAQSQTSNPRQTHTTRNTHEPTPTQETEK